MSEHHFKHDLILDTITDGVLVVDSQGIVLYANQSAEILLARSPIIGQSLAIPVNYEANSYQEINLIHPNGLTWIEMRYSPLEWDGPNGYVITLRDITECKSLELERQKFVSLADNSIEFIGMCDMNFIPFYVNQAGMRLVGLDNLAQCIRTPVEEFFFPEDQRYILDDSFLAFYTRVTLMWKSGSAILRAAQPSGCSTTYSSSKTAPASQSVLPP